MNITTITEDSALEISFLNAGKGPGSYYVDQLPVYSAHVPWLPDELDAVVATADLQGRERFEDSNGSAPRLLGEVLPQRLQDEILPTLRLDPERTGVILAGDFYTVPGLDKRGGSGDVRSVWRAFSHVFKWTIGVAGNHDTFGEQVHPTARLGRNAHYLDGDVITLDGLRVAGLGGIIGNVRRPHRRTDQDFAACLECLVDSDPQILIMHDGPNSPEDRLRGSDVIREALGQCPSLVIRGHAHWPMPLAELPGGTQVLNVHCRVVVLHREDTCG